MKKGFTLVELIVVIAILGILAGVAVPVYSGYIQKANQAADNTLLDVVNTAFAAACLENDVDFNGISSNSASLTYTSKGPITGIASVGTLSGTDLAAVQASFLKYYGGNVQTSLKYYEAGQINFVQGVGFLGNGTSVEMKSSVSNGDGTTTYTFSVGGKDVSYTVNDSDVEAFTESTFGQQMTIGQLMGQVGTMSDAVGAVVNNVTEDGATHKILEAIYGSDVDTILGLTKDESGNYDSEELGNALVLAVAKKTNQFAGQGASTLVANLSAILPSSDARNAIASLAAGAAVDAEGNSVETIDIGGVSMGRGEAMANMAIAYAMMTSYVNSDASAGKTVTVDGQEVDVRTYFAQQAASLSSQSGGSAAAGVVMSMAGTLANSDGFTSYLGSTQATTDMSGYLSAMSSISQNESTLKSDNSIVSNGFDNPEIANILNAIFSSSSGE